MKKLRFFDSLKLVLATVACVFAIMPAHAATLPVGYTELEYLESTGTQWINTNVDERTVDYMELKFETVNDSSGFMFVNGASQVGVKDSRYGTREPGVYIIKQNVLDARWYFTNETNGTTYTNGRVGSAMLYLFNLNNSAGANYKNKNVKIYYYKASKNDSLVFDGIPARRDSDGVLGMYNLADSNPATAFRTNAGTGTFVAGPVAQIKIATTKYNEESFAPVKTDLSAAVNAVEYVVSNTMTQAQAIDTIATTKQTRPAEGCTAKYCLLVEDEDGTPHWYPIAGANGVAHNLPAGYTELQYIESTGTQYIDTGVNIGENIQTKVKFGKTTNSFSKFGFVIGGGDHYQGLVTRTSTNSYYSSMYGSSQNVIVMSIPDNVFEITFNTQGHKVILNNTASYDLVLLSPYEISNTIGIFRTPGSSSMNNNGIGKVYSFVITDNLTNYILFNGIPARRDSDGVVGMYDLADANPATAFHTNAGTGVFGEGPEM